MGERREPDLSWPADLGRWVSLCMLGRKKFLMPLHKSLVRWLRLKSCRFRKFSSILLEYACLADFDKVVRLGVQGELFSVRVLEDTAEIIDFGLRYEDDDLVDRVEGCSVAGSDGGSAAGSFVLESPAPAIRKLK